MLPLKTRWICSPWMIAAQRRAWRKRSHACRQALLERLKRGSLAGPEQSLPETVGLSAKIRDALRAQCAPAAEAVMKGVVRVYGTECDFASQVFWFEAPGSECVMDTEVPADLWFNRADIKVPWKKSCAHFLVPPALTALAGQDARAASKVQEVLSDWIAKNRDPRGVNWASAMEVSFRLAVWAYLAFILQDLWSREWLEELAREMIAAALHVLEHCECTGITTNHYAGNISALGLFALLWPSMDPSGDVWKLAQAELDRISREQVDGQGVHFEHSLHYHRLVCELLAVPHFVSLLLGHEGLGEEYEHRLVRMLEVLRAAVNRAGILPQIGDNDSEVMYCVALEHGAPRDMSPFFSACDHFLGGHFRRYGTRENMAALSGFAVPAQAEEKSAEIAGAARRVFDGPGWVFLRAGGLDLAMVCGELGTRGLGAHDHNHCNEVLVSCGGAEFVVDPGTGCYTRDARLRNRLRSVAAHSTVDAGREPGELGNSLHELWRIRNPWRAKWAFCENDRFEGVCACGGCEHRRTVAVGAEGVSVRDRVNGASAFRQRWVLHPEVTIEQPRAGRVRLRRAGRTLIVESAREWRIEEVPYSETFGRIEMTKALIAGVESGDVLECVFREER